MKYYFAYDQSTLPSVGNSILQSCLNHGQCSSVRTGRIFTTGDASACVDASSSLASGCNFAPRHDSNDLSSLKDRLLTPRSGGNAVIGTRLKEVREDGSSNSLSFSDATVEMKACSVAPNATSTVGEAGTSVYPMSEGSFTNNNMDDLGRFLVDKDRHMVCSLATVRYNDFSSLPDRTLPFRTGEKRIVTSSPVSMWTTNTNQPTDEQYMQALAFNYGTADAPHYRTSNVVQTYEVDALPPTSGRDGPNASLYASSGFPGGWTWECYYDNNPSGMSERTELQVLTHYSTVGKTQDGRTGDCSSSSS